MFVYLFIITVRIDYCSKHVRKKGIFGKCIDISFLLLLKAVHSPLYGDTNGYFGNNVTCLYGNVYNDNNGNNVTCIVTFTAMIITLHA